MCLIAPLAILGALAAPASNGSHRAFERIDSSVSHAVHLRYLVYEPEAYTSQKRWPLIVYLHGGSSRGMGGSGALYFAH